MQYKYLIIGGGMTARAAMQGIRSVDEQGAIGVIAAEGTKPYDRPPLSKGLWKGDLSVDEIVHELPAGVDLFTERRAESISTARNEVVDDQDQHYNYEKLLLATGGIPRRLPFDKDNDNHVLYYRTLQDYHHLRELTSQYDSFAVIGGGFIGSELAAALTINGNKVSLIFPEDAICARLFPADLSGYLNRYYKSKGVTVYPNTKIVDLRGKPGNFVLQTDNGEIAAEAVVAGIGILPATQLAEHAGLGVENGIVVNESLQTDDPAIFAAGDVANFKDQLLGERRRVEHEDNANKMGHMAGRAMAGAKVVYDHSPMFYSDLFDLGYEAVGKLDAKLDTYCDWQEEYAQGVIYYLDKKRLRGVLLWNVWEKVPAARALIASGKQWQPQDLQGQLY